VVHSDRSSILSNLDWRGRRLYPDWPRIRREAVSFLIG
jgi:hypothetical protein